jgi:oligopeptide/dipeptide ABC transporter ATP-binding protein
LLAEGAIKKPAAHAKVREMMELVGLTEEIFGRYPHELSGGMKQRVVIAMALVQEPKLVILDEPTSALDVSVQAQIMNLLKRLKRELGLSLIFITHDIALASDVCDHVAVIYGGRVVEFGDIEGILLRPSHPYTEKLLASMPKLHAEVRPEFIPGAPPDLVEPPPGCRFSPRCSYATDICFTDDPPPFTVEEGHTARCWLRQEDASSTLVP